MGASIEGSFRLIGRHCRRRKPSLPTVLVVLVLPVVVIVIFLTTGATHAQGLPMPRKSSHYARRVTRVQHTTGTATTVGYGDHHPTDPLP